VAGAAVTIDSRLTLRGERGLAANERWLELLSHLQQKRSIVTAAKAAGLSYKAARDAIETMNNLADDPLVERAVGGRGGGGTRLTPSGARLVHTCRAAQQENLAFSINAWAMPRPSCGSSGGFV